MIDLALEELEINLLLEAVFRRFGYDFREYSEASLRRRILHRVETEREKRISDLTARVLHEPGAVERLVLDLTVHTTAMFRDPGFYITLRQKVVPVLRTYPYVRIWHAGCSSGEEVYSTAIVLEEEGIMDRCRIYATDLAEVVLRRAKQGIYPLSIMKEYTGNYIRAGGKRAFSDYYTADHENAIFRPSLRDRVVFAEHNLVTDSSFNEFHLILCRNVMIYFKRSLQDRVHRLLHGSLLRLGLLVLGKSETVKLTPHEHDYEEMDAEERIYRKVR